MTASRVCPRVFLLISLLGPGIAIAPASAVEPIEAIIHLRAHLSPEALAMLAGLRVQVEHVFVAIPAVLVLAPPDVLSTLPPALGATRVETSVPVVAHLSQSASEVGARAGRTPGAHALGVTGRNVTVAVVDFGIDATHPDLPYGAKVVANVALAPRSAAGSRAVALPNTDLAGGHGTHVAGIVAGTGASSRNLSGVAPDALLVGVAIGQGGRTTSSWAAAGLDWVLANGAQHGVRIVTNSWGIQGGSAYDSEAMLERLTAALHAQGVLVIFSVGNDGFGPDGPRWEEDALSGVAMSPYALAVTSYDSHAMHVADSASRGDSGRSDLAHKDGSQRRPDIAAPGEWITAPAALAAGPFGPTRPRAPGSSPYLAMSGTSMAAPHVAGAAALLIEAIEMRGCASSPARIIDILLETARDDVLRDGLGRVAGPEAQGHGALDVHAAVTAALTAPLCDAIGAPLVESHPTAQPSIRGLLLAYAGGAVDPSPLTGWDSVHAPSQPLVLSVRWGAGLRDAPVDESTSGRVVLHLREVPDAAAATYVLARAEREASSIGYMFSTDPFLLTLPPGEYLVQAWLGEYALPRALVLHVAPVPQQVREP